MPKYISNFRNYRKQKSVNIQKNVKNMIYFVIYKFHNSHFVYFVIWYILYILLAPSFSSSSSLPLKTHRFTRSYSPLEFTPGRTQFVIHSRRRLVDSLWPSRSCSNSSSAFLIGCSRRGLQILEPGFQILWPGWVAAVTGVPNWWPRVRWLVLGSGRVGNFYHILA